QPQTSQRTFRLTPASVARGADCGLTLESLEHWFPNRCGQPLPDAARMLLAGRLAAPPRVRRLTVIQVTGEEVARGLLQWPETRSLIEEQIGPTTLVVDEESLAALQEKLTLLGMTLLP